MKIMPNYKDYDIPLDSGDPEFDNAMNPEDISLWSGLDPAAFIESMAHEMMVYVVATHLTAQVIQDNPNFDDIKGLKVFDDGKMTFADAMQGTSTKMRKLARIAKVMQAYAHQLDNPETD